MTIATAFAASSLWADSESFLTTDADLKLLSEHPGLASAFAAAQEQGYSDIRVLEGSVVGVMGFLFTTAIVVGICEQGYVRRYCYESRSDALAALELYREPTEHPGGPWIKCKGDGIDLLNPDFCAPRCRG